MIGVGGVGIVARAGCVWDGKLVVVGDFWNSYETPAWYTIPVDSKGTVIKLPLSLDRAQR